MWLRVVSFRMKQSRLLGYFLSNGPLLVNCLKSFCVSLLKIDFNLGMESIVLTHFGRGRTKPRLFFKSMLFEFLSTFITIENLVSCFQLWTLRTKKLTCWKRQSTTSPFSILFSYRFLNRCTIIARCQTRQLFPVYHLQFNIYPREACLYKSLIKVRLEEGRIQTYAIFITTWTQPQTITRSFSTTVWSAKFQRKETFRCDGAHVVC